MLFSVIIPAHNEEQYIGKCIESIRIAEKVAKTEVEIIVVANRCTDRTAEIAGEMGAVVCCNEDKCIAAIRNTGVKQASGRIIVTIDADSCMTGESLAEIRSLLATGDFIGGGAIPLFDRFSLGIVASTMYVWLNMIPIMIKKKAAVSGAMFWCFKKDFEAVGGFDESLLSLEDMDFAIRLQDYGKTRGKRFGCLKKSYVITSSRKFDQFGDWYLIKDRKLTKSIFTGKDREAADKFYYDAR